MKRLLEEAKKMIRINSETARGNEELATYVMALLQDRGIKSQLQQVTHSIDDLSKRQFNVIGILGDPLVDRKIRKGLLLNTNLDTVSSGIPANWTETGGDPFAAVVQNGKIYGLGSADAKLDFLCKLHAATKFRERKLKMPIYLVGTCGEEIGMFGAKYLIKSLALNPRYVVVGEPSDLRVINAHKSLNVFRVSLGFQQIERDARGFNRRIDLHASGVSAHGAQPQLGTNAIHGSLDFLRRASDAGFEFRFTQFDGGDMINKVPDRAMVQFYLSSHQFEDFKRFFREMTSLSAEELGYPEGTSLPTFKVDLGGIGDTGVRFLPDLIYPCLNEVVEFFKTISSDFAKVKDESFEPPFSTINFGRLKQAPGGLSLHFDLRLLPDLVPEAIEKHVQEGIQKIAARYPSLNIAVVRERMNPGLRVGTEHELVRICEEAQRAAGIMPGTTKRSASTEASQFVTAGFDAVAFGPGAPDCGSHGPNEHNLLEQLEKAVTFYEKLIERVCL